MPSSKNRRRLEIPRRTYDSLKQIAMAEGRPVTSVVTDLLSLALPNYCPTWEQSEQLAKFDASARRALALAYEEAHYYRHNYVGTEHLLLGILRGGQGVAAQALDSLGVELQAARDAAEDILGEPVEHPSSDEPIPPPGWMPYVPRLRKVLSLAAEEARRLGHDYVGTEHLLLAIIREGEGVAAKILKRLGALDEAARVQTLALLKQRDPDGHN